MAVDAHDNVLLTGFFSGSIDFGDGVLQSAGSPDVFIAKLEPNGAPVWSVRAGGASGVHYSQSIATNAAEDVFVAGTFTGSIDFGGNVLNSAGASDIFVTKLDKDGAYQWGKRAGDADIQGSAHLAADNAGNVIVAGSFRGTLDLGGCKLTSAGLTDVYVAKLDPAGACVWSKSAGDPEAQSAAGVAVDSTGNIFVTGSFDGLMDLGCSPLTSAGGSDLFVAKLNPSGACLWSKRAGDSDTQTGSSIAVDGAGNVLVTGSLSGSMDLGGCKLTSAGSSDLYVAKLDLLGDCQWSKSAGDTDAQYGASVATNGMGNVVVTGSFNGKVDLGGGSLVSAGKTDVVVFKLDTAGNHLWSRRAGGTSIDAGRSIALDSTGAALVTGYFNGIGDFGLKPLTSAGASDVFLEKLSP